MDANVRFSRKRTLLAGALDGWVSPKAVRLATADHEFNISSFIDYIQDRGMQTSSFPTVAPFFQSQSFGTAKADILCNGVAMRQCSATDSLDDLRVRKCRGRPFALEPKLVIVNAAGNAGGEN
jgi:hypothetical protein